MDHALHAAMPSMSQAANFTTHIQNLVRQAQESMQKAQNYQKQYYDSKHTNIAFAPGDFVLLSTKHLPMHGSRKLSPRYDGPFRVIRKIGTQAYQLQLPNTLNIHDVFHVSLLRKNPAYSLRDGRAVGDLVLPLQPAPAAARDDKHGEGKGSCTG